MGVKSQIKKFVMGNLVRKESVPIPVLQGSLLKGRCALITGGTSGIGFAVARAFRDNGCEVIITGRSKDRVDLAVAELGTTRVHGIVLDNSRPELFESGIRSAAEMSSRGVIDVLVNNAGIMKGNGLSGTTVEDWDNVIDINLRAVYFLSRQVAQQMKTAGVSGNILNLSSSSALRPADRPYAISKWGIRGLTLGLAKSLIDSGIVVNAIAPGPTATPMLQGEESGHLEHDRIPAGRYAAPEEIADMAVILVSPIGRMVVGDTVYMTGGAGLTTFDDMDYGF